ncbi:proline dehydrogenase family protein [Propionibacterium australiense]|uniref:Proline dehydrogenase n=1 Tax=Propionibacterium australiense TaxID=119981 RepID=A0A383S5E5_9ACTN|nr:proline dehydrogenase family protein [Propionibacterium australiense]RLP09730.1 proline dehydrogenase [Propionibacterium australiense]RLP10213.1 proline dehydrogenase [Propionibacterium australiense]SYZ33200.1 Proline dehydrogenase domain [Propionibacterium australiense]VEH89338.1 Proline dehydrogenase 1 [Propionibacterium australiense]
MRRMLMHLSRLDGFHRLLVEAPATRELIGRYVAGETLDELTEVLADQRYKGLAVSVDALLPEAADDAAAGVNERSYLGCLDALAEAGLSAGADINVKPSALLAPGGGQDLLHARLERICATASTAGADVTVHVNGQDAVEPALAVTARLRRDFPRTGVVLLAGLRRTESDCRVLAADGARIRLCKGDRGAGRGTFPSRHAVDLSYVRCLRVLMASDAYPVIATHDPRLVEIALDLAGQHRREPGDHEFQMLYGVRPYEQRRLADIGRTMRTCVPFGPGWYAYFLQRVADHPANGALYARSLLGRR